MTRIIKLYRHKGVIIFPVAYQEIDQQLYRKYSLDQTEIDFIETRVKEMV